MTEKVQNLRFAIPARPGGTDSRPRAAQHSRAPGARGFSLAELLIAIWILGVGLAMVAALFPAGMKANEHSIRNTIGTLICENGQAVAKALLTHPLTIDGDEVDETSLKWCNDIALLAEEYLQYPIKVDSGADDSRQGFVVLARRATAGENDYQLVIVSYRRSPAKGEVKVLSKAALIQEEEGGFTIEFPPVEQEGVQAESFVILANDGASARITELVEDPDNPDSLIGTLDRPLPTGLQVLFVIQEDGAPISPAMAIMSTRTPLTEAGSP